MTDQKSPPLLRARGLAKSFSLEDQAARSLVGALAGRPNPKVVEVLRGVDLDIHRGESLGILGRNGAGKTTLLSILGGVLEPTAGTVERLGKVSTILGTGDSFQRELSGLENAALFCESLGITGAAKAAALEAAERFADIGDYFRRPLRTYSSGMQARLGFACAANVDAELIIVDEVLAVGDAEFRLKCIGHIEAQQRRGVTYLLVSHSAGLITSICTRAIVLEGGEKVFDGLAREGVAHYRRMTKERELKRSLSGASASQGADAAMTVTHFAHIDPDPDGDGLSAFEFTIRANEAVRNPEARIGISDGKGIGVSLYRTKMDGPKLPDMAPGAEVTVRVTYRNHLVPGRYYYRCSLHSIEENAERMTYYSDVVGTFDVFGDERGGMVDLEMVGDFAAPPLATAHAARATPVALGQAPRVAFFLHLPGDVDALAPIIDEARLSGRVTPVVMVHEDLVAKHPRAASLVDWLGLPIIVAGAQETKETWVKALGDAQALFTACETTVPPHRAAHELSLSCAEAGLSTIAVQHGLENVGLSYFDAYQGVDVRFAAQTVLSWMPLAALPPETPPDTLAKVKVIGRPHFRPDRKKPGVEWPGPARVDVAVFENLHWRRYSDAYRAQLLGDLEAFCMKMPSLSVLVRPHPEGRWLTDRYKGQLPAAQNLTIAAPDDPIWRGVTAQDILGRARFVFTTPSTIAVDAAEYKLPVGIFAYGVPLPLYAPLPMISGVDDMVHIVERQSVAESAAFLARNVAPGGAARRALETVLEKIVQARRAAAAT
ncbi:MAG: ABC transporter ATP-binding protein [Hyphomonadaceae bacterium]|nr:ABC transporter ATP-binding protein [Hyphomonadaceae bacterium]